MHTPGDDEAPAGGNPVGETAVDDEKQYEGMSMGEIIAIKAQKQGAWR